MENRGRKLPKSTQLRIQALLLEKRSIREVARIMKVSVPTVQGIKNALYRR